MKKNLREEYLPCSLNKHQQVIYSIQQISFLVKHDSICYISCQVVEPSICFFNPHQQITWKEYF